jgi:hypothetical protein
MQTDNQTDQQPLHTIRPSYAATLSPEERQALIETLTNDLAVNKNDFAAECMLRALQDAQGLS